MFGAAEGAEKPKRGRPSNAAKQAAAAAAAAEAHDYSDEEQASPSRGPLPNAAGGLSQVNKPSASRAS